MAEERVQRRLAAILAADVVGYSRLVRADEEGTLAALKGIRKHIVEPKIAENGGRIVKLMGDGMLAEFPSAVDAVRNAVEVQQAVTDHQSEVPHDCRIQFRVGVNLGDVVIDGDDIHGDGVNVAARLEGLAHPGGICISGAVHDQVRDRTDLVFEDLGEQEVKNIDRPIRVWRWSSGTSATASGPAKTGTPLPLPDKPSIAVLPFENLSADKDQEYFADGIAEDIITSLSRFQWFFVIARNSSFCFKGHNTDVRQIGRELGVRYILEGSVRRGGNRLRITAQLVEAASGNQLWAEKYDGELNDIFELQDKITEGVVSAVEPSVRRAEIERAKRKRPDSLDAYEIVLQAWPLLYSRMPEDANSAIPLLQKAIALDPAYGLAHAALAWCYHAKFFRAGRHQEDDRLAVLHARRTIALGTDDSTALAMAAFTLATSQERDHETAFRLIERALTLSPSCTFALSQGALMFSLLGKTALAIERAQRALRLNPLDPFGHVPYSALSLSYFLDGRFEEAAEAARRALELEPRFSVLHSHLAAALVRLGRIEDATGVARQILVSQPNFSVSVIADNYSAIAPDRLAPYLEALRKAGLPE